MSSGNHETALQALSRSQPSFLVGPRYRRQQDERGYEHARLPDTRWTRRRVSSGLTPRPVGLSRGSVGGHVEVVDSRCGAAQKLLTVFIVDRRYSLRDDRQGVGIQARRMWEICLEHASIITELGNIMDQIPTLEPEARVHLTIEILRRLHREKVERVRRCFFGLVVQGLKHERQPPNSAL